MNRTQTIAAASKRRAVLRRTAFVLCAGSMLAVVGCTKNGSTGWAQTAPSISAQADAEQTPVGRVGG